MKISGITTRIVAFDAQPRFGHKPIPEHRPKEWAYPMVTIHTDEGIDGYSMGYGPHGDGPAIAEIILNTYGPDIKDKNPLHSEANWQMLMQKNRHLYNLSDAIVGVLDVAFWDIKGKALNASVCQILGQYRNRIKTYATGRVYLPTPEEVYKEALAVRDSGSHGYKLQLWQGPEQDIPRFYAAREAVGAEFNLMQDAAGMYSFADALKVGRELDNLGFYWYEEPINDRLPGLLKKLDDELSLPLLVGETLRISELTGLVENKPFARIRGDVLIKAGITGLQKSFSMCDLFGINLEVHTAGASFLDVANLHVACANKNCEFVELHHPVFRFGIENSPLDPDPEGYLMVPDGPGLGVIPDWDWLENHTISFNHVEF